ncbi:phage terminase large subunit [Parabacteroides sp. PF5-5]|uniref:phage terminase large subunit n=1 Tax=unclassified Parabacteroides TaxID=2649774 RepID=UPI002473FFA8|nr:MULTISPECIES: phage terminase large subunit [unclassified Parabacteroides]MDH6304621.1 phage terminase large subunit [Parabacteroides sp. PH5-39]MDH6315766.1 phage terminase large subunit [Parabacteroides sp. PF5-13]MDH6319425.1 phage terminase large subunit [Parabacteroides sp. PH5-13]MDH6323156.1 phage terminase large subunit [Parabacteroides sp. PH5-8]MDH6326958.1 phage terminase large subunit [Parabacteroides sp. PH5-41]
MDQTIFRFSKKCFNPLYWHIEDAQKDHRIRYILVYGGSSAAKTYSIAQCQSVNALESDLNALVLRKESVTVMTTVYETFKDVQQRINKESEFFDFFNFKIQCLNGNRFVFKGLDDSEKVKGLESFNIVYLNELTKFDEADFDEISRRLRGRPNQKIYADWNPIEETHWIKTSLIDGDEWVEQPLILDGKPQSRLDNQSQKWINKAGDAILIKTTYRDNYWVTGSPCGEYGFVDSHTIANFEKMRLKKPNQYQVYGLGNWGSYRVGGEFWKSFDIDKHVQPVQFLPEKTVHLTIDINRIPYISQTLWQINDKEIRQFEELCAKDPENTAVKAARKVAKYLDDIDYTGVVYIYGDASGKNKSATDNDSFFGVYLREFRKHYIVNDRIMKANPSISMSAAFINDIYEGLTPFSIVIGDNCSLSKVDYNTVKEGKDGEMVKEKVKDSVTGVSYEKNGHISDAKRYFICRVLEKEYKEFKQRRKKYVVL